MTCDETKLLLADYWSQSLDAAEETAFEGHLTSCDACRAEADRLGSFWKSLALVPLEDPSAAVRDRFYEGLSAYRQGLASAPKGSLLDTLASLWPTQPSWQMAASFALLLVGMSVGYMIRATPGTVPAGTELSQLRGEIASMRQLVTLSLLQQQSAGDRLRGVSWAYRVEPSNTEVLSALLTAVNQDSNVNVRLAAVDALHSFGESPVTRNAVVQALPKETTPLVQVALIDLMVDLKEREASGALEGLLSSERTDGDVRQHAQWALSKLKRD